MLKELLESSDPINMPLLVKTVTVANTQKGDPYVRATVGDASASVQAIHFSIPDAQMELWEIDTVVKITGGVEEYQGRAEYNPILSYHLPVAVHQGVPEPHRVSRGLGYLCDLFFERLSVFFHVILKLF